MQATPAAFATGTATAAGRTPAGATRQAKARLATKEGATAVAFGPNAERVGLAAPDPVGARPPAG